MEYQKQIAIQAYYKQEEVQKALRAREIEKCMRMIREHLLRAVGRTERRGMERRI